MLILSTPNEDELPLDKHYNEFHYRQYTYSSIKKILLENKFTIKNVYAQNLFVLDNNGKKFKYLPTKDRIPKEGYNGQHMIIVCVKET